MINLAQARLRIGSGFLTLITIFGRLRHSMMNCFNSSRVGLELVLNIMMLFR